MSINKGGIKDYSQKKYVNPYFKEKKKPIRKAPRAPIAWKRVGVIFLLLAAIIVLAWFLFFSSFFAVKDFVLEGGEGSKANTIIELAREQMQNSRFVFGSQKNIFLYDTAELTGKIKKEVNFLHLGITKKYPKKIIINLEARQAAAIWQESGNYSYVDSLGSIIKPALSEEIASSGLPLIDNIGEQRANKENIANAGVILDFAAKLNNEFRDGRYGFEIDRYLVDNQTDSLKMKIKNGPQVIFNLTKDLSEQITRLDILIKDKLKDDFLKKQYIDLRFGEVINYK